MSTCNLHRWGSTELEKSCPYCSTSQYAQLLAGARHTTPRSNAASGQAKQFAHNLEVVPWSVAAQLENELAAALRRADEADAKLHRIIRTPAMPFPDAGAHSERAFSDAVYRAWSEIQRIARSK